MKQKIKLVFFHPYSYLGGADNSLRRLIERLDTKLFSISFLSLNRSYLKKYLIYKVNFIQLNSKRTLFSILELRKIFNSFISNKNFKKVVVISNQNFANIVTSFAIKKNKKIKSIFIDRNHLDELDFFNNYLDKFKKKIIKYLIKLRYRKANTVIGVSKKLSKDLSKFINRPVKTIYSPSYDNKILKKSREKLNLRKNFKYIVNVSRFSKRKDHKTTLKAFEIILKKIKNINLILIGYGPELNEIRLLSKKMKISKNIIIINKTYNPYKYMKRSNLVILTSIYEGFPNVLTEALTIGTPVIATNSNAGASEILLSGKGGDLIKIGDYKNLAKKIIKYFNNPSKLKNKTIFAQKKLYRFGIERHGKIYSKLFQKI